MSNWVLGSEQISIGEITKTSNTTILKNLLDTLTISDRQQWVGTLRGKIGFAPPTMSNWLIYATGGMAYGSFEHLVTQFCNIGCSRTLTFSDRTTRAEWTVDGGVEYALNRNWSIRAEYLYMDFGKDTLNSAGAPSIPVTSVSFHDRSQVARAALNYKF